MQEYLDTTTSYGFSLLVMPKWFRERAMHIEHVTAHAACLHEGLLYQAHHEACIVMSCWYLILYSNFRASAMCDQKGLHEPVMMHALRPLSARQERPSACFASRRRSRLLSPPKPASTSCPSPSSPRSTLHISTVPETSLFCVHSAIFPALRSPHGRQSSLCGPLRLAKLWVTCTLYSWRLSPRMTLLARSRSG